MRSLVYDAVFDVTQMCAWADNGLPGVRRPTLKPAAREPGGEPLFRIHPLRLFDRKVSGHLVDPGRHPVGQSPFNGEIRGMAHLACGEFGRLLFGALLSGGKLVP
jgi:hypothetical protein